MNTSQEDSVPLRQLIFLRRVRDRIDREFDRPLNVAELAAGVHMSAGHLSRQFRAAYGESPYSYLMTRRIERAMALIRRGDLSITDICFTVGFSSLGTFSTRFSELVGRPPSRYRAAVVEGDHDLPTFIVKNLPTFIVKNVLTPVRNREVPPH